MMDKVAYWLDIADYDLETAKAMFTTRRWLYVAFMCHQVLEKTLKAYWCATQPTDPPYTHNLLTLITGAGLVSDLSPEQKLFIQEMMPLNIEARYPEYKENLLKQLSPDRFQQIIDNTNIFYLWIKSKLLK